MLVSEHGGRKEEKGEEAEVEAEEVGLVLQETTKQEERTSNERE